MKQIISRGGVVICVTSVPYPAFIIKDMKANGYKIVTANDDSTTRENNTAFYERKE